MSNILRGNRVKALKQKANDFISSDWLSTHRSRSHVVSITWPSRCSGTNTGPL